jgi:hypothetical protein
MMDSHTSGEYLTNSLGMQLRSESPSFFAFINSRGSCSLLLEFSYSMFILNLFLTDPLNFYLKVSELRDTNRFLFDIIVNRINYMKPVISNCSSFACEDLISKEGILDAEFQRRKQNKKEVKLINKIKTISKLSSFPKAYTPLENFP